MVNQGDLDKKMSRYWFVIIVGFLAVTTGGILSFLVIRGNGKAGAEDLKDVEAHATNNEVALARVEENVKNVVKGVERFHTEQTTWNEKAVEKMDKILERLPPK